MHHAGPRDEPLHMNEIENAPVDHRATEDARARVTEWTLDFNARWLLVVKSHLEIHLLASVGCGSRRAANSGYYTIFASASLTGTGTTLLTVYPGLAASVKAVANNILRATGA